MKTINEARGIPCPGCNADGASNDPLRRIRADMNEILVKGSVNCSFCGLELKIDRQGSAASIAALERLDSAFAQVRAAAKPKF